MKQTKKHSSLSRHIKKNLSSSLKLSSKNKIKYVKDNRKTAKSGYTSKYQLAIKINSLSEFNKIQKKLLKLALEDKSCYKEKKNTFKCNVKKGSNWYKFGQCREKKTCTWSLLYPDNFEKARYYNINHGIMERLLINPKIFRKEIVLSLINILGEEKN